MSQATTSPRRGLSPSLLVISRFRFNSLSALLSHYSCPCLSGVSGFQGFHNVFRDLLDECSHFIRYPSLTGVLLYFWDFVFYFHDYVLCWSDALHFVLGYICISVKNIVMV